jgi:hypothetical protein
LEEEEGRRKGRAWAMSWVGLVRSRRELELKLPGICDFVCVSARGKALPCLVCRDAALRRWLPALWMTSVTVRVQGGDEGVERSNRKRNRK